MAASTLCVAPFRISGCVAQALDRIERLHVLRERALAERAEEMHLILAREEVIAAVDVKTNLYRLTVWLHRLK